MPTCRNCQAVFPNRLKINGIIKSMQHRRYCLCCSPFKSHVGKLLEHGATSHNIICSNCQFSYKYRRSAGDTLTTCSRCKSNLRSYTVKRKAVDYKGGKCESCGYNKSLAALVFHHNDPSKKEFSIGANHCRKWEDIQIELDKCKILCANCHAEIHETLR